jgi:hypothetical protein
MASLLPRSEAPGLWWREKEGEGRGEDRGRWGDEEAVSDEDDAGEIGERSSEEAGVAEAGSQEARRSEKRAAVAAASLEDNGREGEPNSIPVEAAVDVVTNEAAALERGGEGRDGSVPRSNEE